MRFLLLLLLAGCLDHVEHAKPNDAQKVVARYHENLVIDCINGTVIYIPVDGREFELRCAEVVE